MVSLKLGGNVSRDVVKQTLLKCNSRRRPRIADRLESAVE